MIKIRFFYTIQILFIIEFVYRNYIPTVGMNFSKHNNEMVYFLTINKQQPKTVLDTKSCYTWMECERIYLLIKMTKLVQQFYIYIHIK